MPNEETKTAPELPPRPIAIRATIEEATRYVTEGVYLQFAMDPYITALERQLSAALLENQELRSYKCNADHALNLGIREYQELCAQLAAKDERIAELEAKHGECLPHHVQIELCERLRAAASRVAELEATLKSIREQVVEKPTRFRSQGASWDYYECSEVDPLLEHYAQQVAALQLNQKGRSDD